MPSIFTKAAVAALALGLAHALPQPRELAPRAALEDNSELIAKLKADATTYDRFQRLLIEDGKLITGEKLAKATVFDFKNGLSVPGAKGGTTSVVSTQFSFHISPANIPCQSELDTFPILIGSGFVMTRASLGPCGVFLPHVHPRASEYFVAVEGEIEFGTILELGLILTNPPIPLIEGKLATYEGTVFPQGSIHYQINNSADCKNATAIATLSSEDPGATPFLQMTSGRNATDPDDVRALLPPQAAKIVDSCLARCYPSNA